MPAWACDATRWQVHPLSFTGAERAALPPGEVRHRLPHLQRWLDHLLALGCNGLALGPVAASSTHGYDTVDHVRVDPRLGAVVAGSATVGRGDVELPAHGWAVLTG